jgi:hypothetical protein
MQPVLQPAPEAMLRVGVVLSVLSALFLVMDGVMKVIHVAPVREAHERLGYPVEIAPWLGMCCSSARCCM